MQWLSTGQTHRVIELELGDLTGDCLSATPPIYICRYDLKLERNTIDDLHPGVLEIRLCTLTVIDELEKMLLLHRLAVRDANRIIEGAHFPDVFYLG